MSDGRWTDERLNELELEVIEPEPEFVDRLLASSLDAAGWAASEPRQLEMLPLETLGRAGSRRRRVFTVAASLLLLAGAVAGFVSILDRVGTTVQVESCDVGRAVEGVEPAARSGDSADIRAAAERLSVTAAETPALDSETRTRIRRAVVLLEQLARNHENELPTGATLSALTAIVDEIAGTC